MSEAVLLATVPAPISPMIADWTIKPKKRENRSAEAARLPRTKISLRTQFGNLRCQLPFYER
jgi:hypothetical protein